MKEILKSIQKTLIILIDLEKERKFKICLLALLLCFFCLILTKKVDTTLVLGILGAYCGSNVSQKVKLKNNIREKE